MISLPDVTLIAIDTVAHELTRMAIDDTLLQIKPADVRIWTNHPKPFVGIDAPIPAALHFLHDDACRSADYAEAILWLEAPRFVNTSHVLRIQWDGFVIDGSRWDDAWLRYDYIGAPWPWRPEGWRVGNGGFALWSTRLMRAMIDRAAEFPHEAPWDDVLCRKYRPRLEAEGFRWAPEDVATRFSLEHGPMRPSFGFHDCRNFHRVLSPETVAQRLAAGTDYLRGKTEWREAFGGMASLTRVGEAC